MQTLNAWGQILQQESHAPNVLPAQFQTFSANAAAPVLAALTSVSCTPSIDTTTQYYGAATLKVAITAAGATLSFTGTPIAIAQGSRWFAAFSILAPSGCTGSLTVKTANTTLTEEFTVPAASGWQQVWGVFDLRADASTQATWELTFTSTATVWLDGLQMNLIGSPISTLPRFAGTQMVTGGLAYATSVDLATSQVTNKTANNITYTAGGTVDSLMPAEAAADVTATHTAADTTNVNGVASTSISPIATLMPAEANADVTSTHTSADTSNVNGVAAATISQGAGRANAAIDSTNIVVAAGLDLSRAYTNKTLTNIPDGAARFAVVNAGALGGVSYWDANNNPRIDFSGTYHLGKSLANVPDDSTTGRSAGRWFYLANGSTAGFYKLGTVVFGNYGDSLRIEYTGGQGFNTNSGQQTHATATVRSGDEGAAPNLSGITWYENGGSQAISGIKAAATGGSTAITNQSWDLYVDLAPYANGQWEFILSPGSTFTWSGATGADPGAASSTVVVGTGGPVLNAGGAGADALQEGITWGRFRVAYKDSAARVSTVAGAVSPLGSIATGASTLVASYTSTDAAVTLNWAAGDINRMDGTQTAVSPPSTTVTGLSASTTYYAAAYYDETAGDLAYVTGEAGAVGTPAILYPSESAVVAWQANLQGRVNLGWIPVATVASGGSGGGNGSSGCCLHGSQFVELAKGVLREAQELMTGDPLTSPDGETRIVHLRIEPWCEWYTIEFNDGRILKVAPDHRFVDPSGVQIHARDLKLQDVVQARDCYLAVARLELSTESAPKVGIEVEAPHVYYVDGVLSHNKVYC